jgi:hypothetical protein
VKYDVKCDVKNDVKYDVKYDVKRLKDTVKYGVRNRQSH